MANLILSSTTMCDWDIDDILDIQPRSKDWDIETILQYENDNTIGPYCQGLTYLEIELLNNIQYVK